MFAPVPNMHFGPGWPGADPAFYLIWGMHYNKYFDRGHLNKLYNNYKGKNQK